MSIVDVKKMVEEKKNILKEEIIKLKEYGIIPHLAVILASDDSASRIYVGRKRKICEELGIEETVSTEELQEVVERLNKNEEIHGILIQLPLFKHIDEQKILNSVKDTKDVDGFSAINTGRLYQGNEFVVPCTPKGIMTILKELEPDLSGKAAVVIGRSLIVGKPMAMLLLNESMTTTICHAQTKDISKYSRMADVLVVATGTPHLIKKDMVKEGSIVIDVGLTKVKDKLVGDVDTEEVAKIVKYVTPSPGGVGITTVYSLAENIVMLAKRSYQDKKNKNNEE